MACGRIRRQVEGRQYLRPGPGFDAFPRCTAVDRHECAQIGHAIMRRVLLVAIAFIGLGHPADAQTVSETCPLSEDATARRECLFKLWWEQSGKEAAAQASSSAP